VQAAVVGWFCGVCGRQGLVFACGPGYLRHSNQQKRNRFSSLKTTTMKQIFAFFGCFLLVAAANAQSPKVTTSPKVTAPVISPLPSPVNLLAKPAVGWNIVAPMNQPKSQPANSTNGKGGTINGTWDIAKNSID
jgi:hypothetical protein